MSTLTMCNEYNDVVAEANKSSLVHGKMASDMTQWENNIANAYTGPNGILTKDYDNWAAISDSDADSSKKDAAYKTYENDQTKMQTSLQENDTVTKPETGEVAQLQSIIQNWTTMGGTISQVQTFLSNHLSIK